MSFRLFLTLFGMVMLLLMVFIGISEAKETLTFWSNETEQYFMGESKLIIDHNAYVSDYNLDNGWILFHSNLTELVAICDPFSGKWIKIVIKQGDTNVTLPFKPKAYAGMKLLIISSPWGFGIIKEKISALAWYDYPIVILRSEMAKWSWERTAYALFLFLVGLALSKHVKKDRLIVSGSRHLFVMAFIIMLLFAILSMKYTTETVKINETVKQIPHLAFSTYYIKEWYNYAFALCFVAGYIFGLMIWSFERLYVAYVSYSQPLRIYAYPYDSEKGIIRDFDGKLAKISFDNDFRQFINLEINGSFIKGILAVSHEDIEDRDSETKKPKRMKLNNAIIAFFGFMALSIVGDYLDVFKIDLPYILIFSILVGMAANLSTIRDFLGLDVQKVKVLVCSEIMNEDNYTKMLKEAEIKHVVTEYRELLKALVREKITQPRKVISELLSVIREVREVEHGEDEI